MHVLVLFWYDNFLNLTRILCVYKVINTISCEKLININMYSVSNESSKALELPNFLCLALSQIKRGNKFN